MQRRIFIAIDLDNNTKKYIENKIASFAEKITGKWTPKDDYHITLSFLGHVDDDMLAEVISSLRENLSGEEAFDMRFDRLIWGPNEQNKKMIWIQGPQDENLIRLKNKVEEAMSGKEEDMKIFSPHITLVRFRRKELLEAEKEINPPKINISATIPVQEVKIMESVFADGRKCYQTLDNIELD